LQQADGYVQGLFRSSKGQGNCHSMGSLLQDFGSQNLHHMLTSSPWCYQDLFAHIFKHCCKLLSHRQTPVYLLIDEVGFRKKGTHSACVGHQYIGSIGKHDNGQVAVTAAVSSEEFYCPVNMELFMPSSWTDNMKQRRNAAIPDTKQQQSKTTMALTMIKQLYKRIPARQCVVFDALYGNNVDLLYQLKNLTIPFVGDIRDNLTVYLSQPDWQVPEYSGRGKRFKKKHPTKKPVKINRYIDSLKKKQFKLLTIRTGTKGVLQARYHLRKVWVLHKPSQTFLQLNLLIRKNADGSTRAALSFFNGNATLKKIAKAQAQRVFIERVFEEGKNIVGMGDYQTRSWIGFHQHVALASLALLFLMEQKIVLRKSLGKITSYQIQILINAFVKTLCSIEQVIQNLSKQIPQYQKQIRNQLKTVT